MTVSIPTLCLVTVAFIGVAWLSHRLQFNKRLKGHTLPPGPRRLPIIGNLLDFGSAQPWALFREWASQYGEITYLDMAGKSMIIVSSAQVVTDLLDKRSAIYSDRPYSPMDEIVGCDWIVALMPYGQPWRDRRRCFHQHFNQFMSPKYRESQTREAHNFLRNVYRAGGVVAPPVIRQMLGSLIAEVVYGMQVEGPNDEYIQLVEYVVGVLNQIKVPGAFWVDFIPFLKHVPAWVPGAAAKQLGEKFRPIIEKSKNYGYDFTQSNPTSKACIASELIARIESNHDQDKEHQEKIARDATALAYSAGVDTSMSFLCYFFAAMASHPDVQAKAQQELDEIVGSGRLPTFDDYRSLPYLQALLLECARWIPVLPLGLPHQLMEDDYYKQYFIPKGTVIWPDSKGMLHNPEDYPEPERFNPDRFLKDGAINPEVRDPTTISFGFGRRICPGRHFAMDNAFIITSTVLHVYNIRPGVDKEGGMFDPSPTNGIVTFPKRLICSLTPRSNAAEELIQSVL